MNEATLQHLTFGLQLTNFGENDIEGAFEAVKELVKGGRQFMLECYTFDADCWVATFKDGLDYDKALWTTLYSAIGRTAPTAIRRAALKLILGSVTDEEAD